jgi:hypothetical protein
MAYRNGRTARSHDQVEFWNAHDWRLSMTINRRGFMQATSSLVALNLASLSVAAGPEAPVT